MVTKNRFFAIHYIHTGGRCCQASKFIVLKMLARQRWGFKILASEAPNDHQIKFDIPGRGEFALNPFFPPFVHFTAVTELSSAKDKVSIGETLLLQ